MQSWIQITDDSWSQRHFSYALLTTHFYPWGKVFTAYRSWYRQLRTQTENVTSKNSMDSPLAKTWYVGKCI